MSVLLRATLLRSKTEDRNTQQGRDNARNSHTGSNQELIAEEQELRLLKTVKYCRLRIDIAGSANRDTAPSSTQRQLGEIAAQLRVATQFRDRPHKNALPPLSQTTPGMTPSIGQHFPAFSLWEWAESRRRSTADFARDTIVWQMPHGWRARCAKTGT